MAVKFLCDHMLGTLAKWLRFLGYDVAYPGPLEDSALIGAVEREERVLLTRDRELAGRVPGSLYVTSHDLDEQLLAVARTFDLQHEGLLTRCSVCNTTLRDVPKADVRDKVPEGVFERQDEFWHCDGCGRYYWHGSHWDHMTTRFRELRVRLQGERP